MIPPGNEGVNFSQVVNVGSLKRRNVLMDFTVGFLGAILELLPPAIHCNFVLTW